MAYISKEDNDIEQNFDILDLNTKLSKKSTPWIKNTPVIWQNLLNVMKLI